MLSQSAEERTFKSNLVLSSFTAFTAGMTNVAGIMACYTVTANVTGHTAAFAKHMLERNWFEMFIVLMWIFMFMLGAFIAHFFIRSFAYKGSYVAHALPIIFEALILLSVSVYGMLLFDETETETILITAMLLLSMGVQNSAVSVISGSGIKTSHLTGLLTDLGSDVSEWLHPKTPRPGSLKRKLQLRFTILFCYIIGALIGGILFLKISFITFSIITAVLLLIVLYDLSKMQLQKNKK